MAPDSCFLTSRSHFLSNQEIQGPHFALFNFKYVSLVNTPFESNTFFKRGESSDGQCLAASRQPHARGVRLLGCSCQFNASDTLETFVFQIPLSIKVKISDMTGEHWITCFQNTAEVILGRSAEELGTIKESKAINSRHLFFLLHCSSTLMPPSVVRMRIKWTASLSMPYSNPGSSDFARKWTPST